MKSRLNLEEEDESELEAVLKAENERAWRAREAVWEENRRQKAKLAKEVADGMAAQVARHRQDALDIEAAVCYRYIDLYLSGGAQAAI